MDYSEFLRRIGADPHDADPEIAHARASDETFDQAAREALELEAKLQRAVDVPIPDDLIAQIRNIPAADSVSPKPALRWRSMAIAAGLLIAIGAAGISWNMNHSWNSVDEYVVDHYHHDGDALVQRATENPSFDVQATFARFDVTAQPLLADDISMIKYCPTPDGRGVHMVLDTPEGPVTVIYMPETDVEDGPGVEFDGMNSYYVQLDKGSAVIIGKQQQAIDTLHALVQESIVPAESKA